MTTVVVKLGGAAITDKSCPDRLSVNLDSLVDRVATVYLQSFQPHGNRLILIHGAGSFGHPPAKKYRVKNGWQTLVGSEGSAELDAQRLQQDQDAVKFGMALTRQRVLELHQQLLQRLQDRGGLPVLSVSTYDTVETNKGTLTVASGNRLVARVQQLLGRGFIPLLFGDAVFDQSWGSTILSGDALMHQLATCLPTVTRCVFVTDVAGIYTKDPKHNNDAVLLHRLHCSDSTHGAVDESSEASVDDVTGAMRSKWEWAARIITDAPQLQQVIICQASDSYKALAVPESETVEDGQDSTHGASAWTTVVR